jgi:hypothetical protein
VYRVAEKCKQLKQSKQSKKPPCHSVTKVNISKLIFTGTCYERRCRNAEKLNSEGSQLASNGARQLCFPGARGAAKQHTTRRLDPQVPVYFRVDERPFHKLQGGLGFSFLKSRRMESLAEICNNLLNLFKHGIYAPNVAESHLPHPSHDKAHSLPPSPPTLKPCFCLIA